MKKFLQLSLLALFLVSMGCSHKITRIGYEQGTGNNAPCNVVIKNMAEFDDSDIEILGTIKLGDTGFSTKCEESQAIEILRKEACALNADVVNIIEEKRADIWSTCYRVEAEFYKLKDSSKKSEVVPDFDYSDESIDYRVDVDKDNKAAMIIGSILGSLLGFFLVSSMY